MQVIKRCQQHICTVFPQALDCEKSLCLAEPRRLSKNYEITAPSVETFVKVICIRRMVRLLK